MATNDDQEARLQLALACRILNRAGLAGTGLGHQSSSSSRLGHFLVKPRGLGLDEVTPEDVVLVDGLGQTVEGLHRPPGEWPIHAEILRARPDVKSVVHVHPLHANVLWSAGLRLEPFTQEGTFFVDSVEYSEEARLIANVEQGRALARSLKQARVLFLRNHGVIVVGASIEEACMLTLLLEQAAQAQVLAVPLGGKPMPLDIAREMKDRLLALGRLKQDWDYAVRRL